MTLRVHEVSPEAVPDWDRRTVEGPGGDVYQSREWADYRARWGWEPRYLMFEDGFPLLSLERPWPWIGGLGAYLSRGPVSAGEPVERTAERLVVASEFLAEHGVDVVSSDAEIPTATGYPALIERAGFRPIEEAQPSRHRMSLPFPAGTTRRPSSAASASPYASGSGRPSGPGCGSSATTVGRRTGRARGWRRRSAGSTPPPSGPSSSGSIASLRPRRRDATSGSDAATPSPTGR